MYYIESQICHILVAVGPPWPLSSCTHLLQVSNSSWLSFWLYTPSISKGSYIPYTALSGLMVSTCLLLVWKQPWTVIGLKGCVPIILDSYGWLDLACRLWPTPFLGERSMWSQTGEKHKPGWFGTLRGEGHS